jgi:hypothetical protein
VVQAVRGYVLQVKPERGTGPLDVGGLNVQLTVSTSSFGSSNIPFSFESWNSLIVADVKDTSVMSSVQFALGSPSR